MKRCAIRSVRAIEVLDSRGYPTLSVAIKLTDGLEVSTSVPAGGSSSNNEARHLRDRDAHRYDGRGVLGAAANINNQIAPRIVGMDPTRQSEIDRLMIELDGTPDKSRLGANSILGVSMAIAKAGAIARRMPLYAHLGGLRAHRLPMPMINILNGGHHADNNLDFEEFMVVPTGATTFHDAIRYGVETFHALRRLLLDRHYYDGIGDEGGFAPDLFDNEKACELIVEAIRLAGFEPGRDIGIAIDIAANSFYRDGMYHLSRPKPRTLDRQAMIGLHGSLIQRFPIVAIEDGLADDDWMGFIVQTSLYGWKVQIIGDDLYATDPRRISAGVAKGATNAVVIRPNQIGTITETIQAAQLCQQAGWGYIVANRAGDTEDTFIADLAVALGGGQIKIGSVCRGERIAKYNRLLEIEAELGPAATFFSPMQWEPWETAAKRNRRHL